MKQITEGIVGIGVDDREIDLFEGQYPVPNGMSYNSYVIFGDKIAVMDTVDRRFVEKWLDNLDGTLGGRKPDFLVVQHMEPDHSSGVKAFAEKYPDAKIVGNTKTFVMLAQYFEDLDLETRKVVVADGGTLDLGNRTLTFVFTPMVHWPEVMMTYDAATKTFFSADAFGKFGASDADEYWTDEARRYYIGIVGKYGVQVQSALAKAAKLDIARICSLHGPVLTSDLGSYIGMYDTWSKYEPEDKGVTVAYTSVYGHTEEAAKLLAGELTARGVKTEVFDLARCDISAAVASAFRYDRLALATTTYNGDIFPYMRTFIDHLTERNFRGRTVAMIENGTWAPMAAKVMKGMLEGSKDITYASVVTLRSAVGAAGKAAIAALADELAKA